MHKTPNQTQNKIYFIWTVITILTLVTLACGLFVTGATSTQAPSALPTGTIMPLAVIASPTTPPLPTVENTPEITNIDVDSQIAADVQDYYEKGYLPYQNGDLTSLPDFSKTQISATDNYDFTRTGAKSQDFALWADIELNTNGSAVYPNYSGCGFFYHVQSNSQGYTAILTNTAVRMGACSADMNKCELFGTVYGTGEVDVQNKTKTRFSLAVNKTRAFVLVNGILAGQYNLYTTRLQGMGDLYYAAVSNLGAGYWTACQMTNIKLWESRP